MLKVTLTNEGKNLVGLRLSASITGDARCQILDGEFTVSRQVPGILVFIKYERQIIPLPPTFCIFIEEKVTP